MFVPLIINNKTTQYLISDIGEIKNIKTNKILKGTIRNGYQMVKLTINSQKKDFLIHRLVATTFLENPLNLPQVNHKDKNKLNNAVSNLEWVSIQENMLHRSKNLFIDKKIRKKKEKIILNEHWRQYKNSNYWISDTGKCYNQQTQYLLSPIKSGNYYKYCFSINGKKESALIHKLVYSLFKDDYDEQKQINHIDGNKQNNSLENLELVTNQQNVLHSYYILHNNIHQIGQFDIQNNLIAIYDSMSAAARAINGSVSAISQVCAGKAKTHKGFIWKKIV